MEVEGKPAFNALYAAGAMPHMFKVLFAVLIFAFTGNSFASTQPNPSGRRIERRSKRCSTHTVPHGREVMLLRQPRLSRKTPIGSQATAQFSLAEPP
jgi:hypothetical protein